ncbi:MAG: hypothetical protein Q9219_006466 [cf. Caloplaca sp. 3 TL-2023]
MLQIQVRRTQDKFKPTSFLQALKAIRWGVANNYVNSPPARKALSELAECTEKTDPELKDKVDEASFKSGLHPTTKDSEPHWTLEFFKAAQEGLEWVKTVHVYPEQFSKFGIEKPQEIVDEEEKVLANIEKLKAESEVAAKPGNTLTGPTKHK